MKLLFLIITLTFISCSQPLQAPEKPLVFASIPPQRFMIEKIAGDILEVDVMLQPGQDPHTYDPRPRQIQRLRYADAYFSIGIEFETKFLNTLKKAFPHCKIVHTSTGINLRHTDTLEALQHKLKMLSDHTHKHSHKHKHSHHHHHGNDPHTWTSPANARIQATHIYKALIALYPKHAEQFTHNYFRFIEELELLSSELQNMLDASNITSIAVFHPAWGYFADEFNLVQLPVELEGKEPTPRQLIEIIRFFKEQNVRVIFIQPQFSPHIIEQIAKEIDAVVVSIDPLAYDYIHNLRTITQALLDHSG